MAGFLFAIFNTNYSSLGTGLMPALADIKAAGQRALLEVHFSGNAPFEALVRRCY
jgi:hypothetical protein